MRGGVAAHSARLKRISADAIATHLQQRFVANCSEFKKEDRRHFRYNSAVSRRDAPEVCKIIRPRVKRAQGMPGACCTRGLVCKSVQKKRTRAYRYRRSIPTFPA